jgi:hypothetical protein
MSSADVLRQLATTPVAEALTDGADALDQLPQLEATNAALVARVAADQATIDAQQAKIAALEAQLAPKRTTQFGIDLSDLGPDQPLTEAQKVSSHRALGLPLTHVRVFFGTSVPSWSSERIKALDPTKGDSILISTLSRDVAGMTTFLKNTPDEWRGHVEVAHGHEREADLLAAANPTAAVNDWLAGNLEKATMLDGLGSWGYSSDDLVKILLWFSQVIDPKCKGTQERFYGGQDFGKWGMDCYHYQYWLNALDRYATPAELFDPVIDFAAQIGRPCVVPEWGGTLAKTDTDGTRRAQAIAEGGAYLQAKGVVHANWWCGAGSKDASQPTGWRNHHLDVARSNVDAFLSLAG